MTMTADLAERYRTTSGHTVTIACDRHGWFRWVLTAGNGAEQANSAQLYSRKDAALRAARRLHPPAS